MASGKIVGQSGKGYSAEIRIEGLKETLAALKAFEPDLYKNLRRTIRAELRKLAGGARSRYGGDYRVSTRDTGRKAGGSVTARIGPMADKSDWTSPATKAVIMEFAKNGKTPQARGMIDFFQSYFGSPGRFLWAEWDSDSAEVMNNIETAVRDAERTLQQRLDAAGVSY